MKKFFVVAETPSSVLLDFVNAESPQGALMEFDILHDEDKSGKLYYIKIYEDPLDYQMEREPLEQWLSPRAASREQGITCACGAKTELFRTNADGTDTADLHICHQCNKKTLLKFVP